MLTQRHVGGCQQGQRLGVVGPRPCRAFQKRDGLGVILLAHEDGGHDLARAHVLGVFLEVAAQIGLGLFVLAQTVVGNAAQQHQLRTRLHRLERQRIQRARRRDERAARCLVLPLPSGLECLQIGASRVTRKLLFQHGHVPRRFLVAVEIEQQGRPGNQRIQIIGLQRQRLAIARQRIRGIALRMGDRTFHVPAGRIGRFTGNGPLRHGRRLGKVSAAQIGHGLRNQCGRIGGIELPGLLQRLDRRARLFEVDLRIGARDEHLVCHLGRQSVGRKTLQQGLVPAQQVIDLDLHGDDLRPVRAQPLRIRQYALRAQRRAAIEVGLAQQDQGRQHLAVLLQGVLQLYDGALGILVLHSYQRILVIPRGFLLAAGRARQRRRQRTQQENQQNRGPSFSWRHPDAHGVVCVASVLQIPDQPRGT